MRLASFNFNLWFQGVGGPQTVWPAPSWWERLNISSAARKEFGEVVEISSGKKAQNFRLAKKRLFKTAKEQLETLAKGF